MVVNREELIKIIKEQCFDKALKDIKKVLDAQPDLAVFILGACFIDAMAGFRFGITKEKIENYVVKNKDNFKNFVKEYLPQYIADDLYGSLRCGLLHNYVEYGKYAFRNRPLSGIKHRDIWNNKIIIIDENFYEELKGACDKFVEDILNKDEVFINVLNRYESMGIMKIVTI